MNKEDRVVRQIVEMIREAPYETGSRLPSERDLARRFETSRHTLRSAIRTLEAAGALQVRGGSGCYVLSTTALPADEGPGYPGKARRDLGELLEARFLLEPAIGALAAEKASPDDVGQLEGCLMRIGRAIMTGSSEDMAEENRRFQERIVSCTGNELLRRTGVRLCSAGPLFFRIFESFQTAEREAVFAGYVAIVNAFKEGNPEAVGKHVRHHILRVSRLLRRYGQVELPEAVARAIEESPGRLPEAPRERR